MMLLSLGVILFAAIAASASPHSRNKRFAYASPFGVYTGVGGFPFGGWGPGASAGAFAGAGAGSPFPFPGFPFPYTFPFPYFPVPVQNWYEGENVCKDVILIKDPKEFQDWLKGDSDFNDFDYNHESESCRGNNNKYICSKRIVNNGVSQVQATKYECCHGFVRNPNGPGCVESSAGQPSGTELPLKANDNLFYQFVPKNAKSSSSSTSFSAGYRNNAVDRVPPQ